MRQRLRALWVMVAITYQADRLRAVATLGITVVDAVFRALFAAAPRFPPWSTSSAATISTR